MYLSNPIKKIIIICLVILPYLLSAQEKKEGSDSDIYSKESKYGKPNPNAPKELSHFAFLIGKWKCKGKFKANDGKYYDFESTWTGRYILDGYAIADEYRTNGPNGEPVFLGVTYRVYNDTTNTWEMRWLDALKGSWTKLGLKSLGGVKVGEDYITFKNPGEENTINRVKFYDISDKHFKWSSDKSTDGGNTWDKNATIIEANLIDR